MKLNIICQYHPAACLHQPRLWAVMLNDWESMPEKVDHDFTITSTNEFPPLVAVDTENDPNGELGVWSMAWRGDDRRLYVRSYEGADYRFKFPDTAIMHNAKWDLRVLERNGMALPKNVHDTMIAAYCMGLGRQDVKDFAKSRSGDKMIGGLGLKYLARRHLGMEMKSWGEVYNKPELVPEYNADDSIATYLLFEKWRDQLPQHYWDIDMPLLRVLMAMEDHGVQLNPDFLAEFSKILDGRLGKFEEIVQHLAYHTQDLQSYIYGTLGIEPWKFTDTGAPSVDADVLEGIPDPTVKQVLEYKELFKDKGTYIDSYVNGRDEHDRIHPEFKQTSTSTGRLSCARPNIQNVDKTGTMRKLFVAAQGKKLVRLDWKLVEFGMLAVLAKDERLIDAFLHGDIHQETADALEVDRGIGKHINFLMQNGGTAWGMSSTYGIPIDLAKTYFKKYFERFPAIGRFHEEIVSRALETKQVTGPFGRTRRLDALFASDWRVKREGEKEAKTMPMQNGAAELVKLAMIDLHYKHHAPMTLQVHDELLFEIDTKDAEDYAQWLREYVPTITEIDGIQFPVDVSIGDNWWELSVKKED